VDFADVYEFKRRPPSRGSGLALLIILCRARYAPASPVAGHLLRRGGRITCGKELASHKVGSFADQTSTARLLFGSRDAELKEHAGLTWG
jgi:hypothetical protein